MKPFKLFLASVIVIAAAVLCERIISNSIANQRNKNDYAELNHVKYGLFSVDEWKRQITALNCRRTARSDGHSAQTFRIIFVTPSPEVSTSPQVKLRPVKSLLYGMFTAKPPCPPLSKGGNNHTACVQRKMWDVCERGRKGVCCPVAGAQAGRPYRHDF